MQSIVAYHVPIISNVFNVVNEALDFIVMSMEQTTNILYGLCFWIKKKMQ